MKKTGTVLGCVVLFLAVFWLGFVVNFPGRAVSGLIESRVNRGGTVEIAARPARLGLTAVSLPGVRVSWQDGDRRLLLFTAEEIAVPLSFGLWSGVGLEVALGREGSADIFVPWDGGGVSLTATGVRLEDLKAWSAWAPLRVQGVVELTGNVTLPRPAGGRVTPPLSGSLNGKASNLQISNLKFAGAELPPLRFEAVEVGVRLGRQIRLERGTFRGDIQGTVSGTLSPRGGDFSRLGLNLTVAAALRQTWLQQLGPLRPIVEAFVDEGRLAGSLTGTAASPRWVAAKGGR